MKFNKATWLTAAALGLCAATASAQQPGSPYGYRQVATSNAYPYAQQDPAQQAVAPQAAPAAAASASAIPCDCGQPVCGCEAVCDSGCEAGCDGGCDSGCGAGLGLGHGLTKNLDPDCCDLGDPFSLFGECCGITVGGWASAGYHSQRGGFRFNQHPDNVNLHQGWLYAEKAIDTSNGFDLGGRVDYVYGVDGQDTQAFGLNNGHWDTDWDHGIYGSAIPQAYLEAGYGDLSVKVGHFFTLIGYEVVAAPDNFFYSHAYTMNNSEPFTHTGALATYKVNDVVTAYGGWTLGWDSGFDDNGDSFLGGLSYAVNDDLSVTYATVAGRFGRDSGERGYMHSVVANSAVTDKLNYIFQTDYLDTEDASGATYRNTFDINQWLIYSISDCLAIGTRAEWWNVNSASAGFYGPNAIIAPVGGNTDIYALTVGLNYRPHANVLIRPEVRTDWVKEDAASLNAADILINEGNRASQTTFGIDTIFLF